MLISPICRGQVEEEDPAMDTEKEMLGEQKGSVVSWQK